MGGFTQKEDYHTNFNRRLYYFGEISEPVQQLVGQKNISLNELKLQLQTAFYYLLADLAWESFFSANHINT